MKTIYKYNLELTDTQIIPMPYNAEIISVKNQNNNLVLYAIVDTENEIRNTYEISIFGTGNPIDNESIFDYIGTCIMQNGLVWNIFSRIIG